MKIGVDASCLEADKRTGVSTYTTDILKNLQKIAPENEYYLYFKAKSSSGKLLSDKILQKKILKKPSILSWINKPFWNRFCIPNELLLNKIDIFFSPNYSLPNFWSPTKSIVTLHDISYEIHPEWFPLDFLKTIRSKAREAANKSSLIITNSKFCKSEIIKNYKVDESKVCVIYPGIDKHFLSGRKKSTEIKKLIFTKYKIREPFLISVGQIYPRRNVPGLIKAFSKISKKIKNHQLVIIGQDRLFDKRNIKSLVEEANSSIGSKRIIYVPFIPDGILEYLYKKADIHVSLSNYEGFGSYSMLESMFYGCPVVAVRESSMPELIGDAGFYVSHDKIDEIGDTIVQILSNKALMNRKSLEAKERIRKFSTINMTKEFINACKKVYEN